MIVIKTRSPRGSVVWSSLSSWLVKCSHILESDLIGQIGYSFEHDTKHIESTAMLGFKNLLLLALVALAGVNAAADEKDCEGPCEASHHQQF